MILASFVLSLLSLAVAVYPYARVLWRPRVPSPSPRPTHLRVVQLHQPFAQNMPGELAGFPSEVADHLVSTGRASLVDPKE